MFIAKNEKGQFLGQGCRWFSEYPDAEVFKKKSQAAECAFSTGQHFFILKDYGTDNEVVVFDSEAPVYSRYGWVITKDKVDNGSRVGTYGPNNVSPEMQKKLKREEGTRWRCLDDDGEVYYEGRFIGDHGSEDGFAPLENFAGPNAGATSIQYWKSGGNGGWETL